MDIPNEVRHTIDEINGIEIELTAAAKRTKLMRKRRDELLENLSKYLETTRAKSILYRGKTYTVEKQNKLVKK